MPSDFQENLQIIISLLTLGGIIFAIYKSFNDKDIKVGGRLDILDALIAEKERTHDRTFAAIERDMTLIKENHLKHIEEDISALKGDLKAILAILNYQKNNKE